MDGNGTTVKTVKGIPSEEISVQRSSKCWRVGLVFLITSLCYLYWSVSGNLYIYLDNMTVSMVSSGMFGDNYFCQYLHPLLNIIIFWLSKIIPTADVFALLVHTALFGGVFFMTAICVNLVSEKPIKEWDIRDYLILGVLLLAVLFFVFGMNIWGVNYTVQTAAILFSGLVILSYAYVTNSGKTWVIAGTLLIAFGYLIRLESALLFIPFIGLEVCTAFLVTNNKKESFHKCLKYFGAAALVIAVLLLSKGIFNSLEPYVSDNGYTEYRTIVEDYPMGSYDQAKGDAVGVDEVTYNLVSGSWVLIDTDRINTATLKGIAQIGSKNAYAYDLHGLHDALKEMYRRVRTTDIYMLILVVMTIILTIRNVAVSKSGWLKAEAVLAFLGGFIILLYFTFRGRALFRVWQTVLLAVNAVLVCNSIHIWHERKAAVRWRKIPETLFILVMCVLLYYSAGQMIAHTELHSPISPLISRLNVDDSAYEETFEDDGLYIWSNWYLTIPSYFSDQNKLPTQRVVDHNIPIGDWTYGQVYFREFLAERNTDNPAIALIERPNTYIMGGYVSNFMEYMHRIYGEDLALAEAQEINGVKAYRMERGNGDE